MRRVFLIIPLVFVVLSIVFSTQATTNMSVDVVSPVPITKVYTRFGTPIMPYLNKAEVTLEPEAISVRMEPSGEGKYGFYLCSKTGGHFKLEPGPHIELKYKEISVGAGQCVFIVVTIKTPPQFDVIDTYVDVYFNGNYIKRMPIHIELPLPQQTPFTFGQQPPLPAQLVFSIPPLIALLAIILFI